MTQKNLKITERKYITETHFNLKLKQYIKSIKI